MRHFAHNLENEQRIVRGVGGLTSALGNLMKAISVIPTHSVP